MLPTVAQRVASRWLTAVAPPSGKVFYHGTPKQSAADVILVEGLKPRAVQGRSFMAPVMGRVYLTPHLSYALIYAIGGDFAGSSPPPKEFTEEPFGFVFAVPSDALTDLQPDEDSIGEMVQVASEPIETQRKFYPDLAGKIPVWLSYFAERHLTPRQLSKVLEGEVAYYASAGKRLVKMMSPRQMQEIIDAGAHVANEGIVRPSSCWKVEKARSAEMKRDGSNFFEIATPYR